MPNYIKSEIPKKYEKKKHAAVVEEMHPETFFLTKMFPIWEFLVLKTLLKQTLILQLGSIGDLDSCDLGMTGKNLCTFVQDTHMCLK